MTTNLDRMGMLRSSLDVHLQCQQALNREAPGVIVHSPISDIIRRVIDHLKSMIAVTFTPPLRAHLPGTVIANEANNADVTAW